MKPTSNLKIRQSAAGLSKRRKRIARCVS